LAALRALALSKPVYLGSLASKTVRYAPPSPIAASLLLKLNYLTAAERILIFWKKTVKVFKLLI
jgi:hypothetical protein